jgi:hypothetical protein
MSWLKLIAACFNQISTKVLTVVSICRRSMHLQTLEFGSAGPIAPADQGDGMRRIHSIRQHFAHRRLAANGQPRARRATVTVRLPGAKAPGSLSLPLKLCRTAYVGGIDLIDRETDKMRTSAALTFPTASACYDRLAGAGWPATISMTIGRNGCVLEASISMHAGMVNRVS